MRLFFYIFRRYCGYMLAVVALCLFLFIFFDFSHRATVFFNQVNPPSRDIAMFYFYLLPFLSVQALPVSALLAAVLTMLVLGRSHEITAMRAAGAGVLRLAMPLLAGGVLCSILGVVASEWLVPVSSAQMRRLEAQMAGDTAYRDKKHVWLKSGKTIFRYRAYDPYRQQLLGLKQIHLHDDLSVQTITTAHRADYLGSEKAANKPASAGSKKAANKPASVASESEWLLHETHTWHYDQQGLLQQREVSSRIATSLPFKLDWLQREQRKPLEMPRAELVQLITTLHARGEDTLNQQVDLHLKFAYPCAALFVVLLGLRFGFFYQRRALHGVLATFAFGFAYWLLLGISTTLGRVGALTPLTSAWLANVVLLCYCLGQVRLCLRPARG